MFAKTKDEKMFKETIYQRPEKSMRQGVNHLVGMVIIQAVFQLFRADNAKTMKRPSEGLASVLNGGVHRL